MNFPWLFEQLPSIVNTIYFINIFLLYFSFSLFFFFSLWHMLLLRSTSTSSTFLLSSLTLHRGVFILRDKSMLHSNLLVLLDRFYIISCLTTFPLTFSLYRVLVIYNHLRVLICWYSFRRWFSYSFLFAGFIHRLFSFRSTWSTLFGSFSFEISLLFLWLWLFLIQILLFFLRFLKNFIIL